MKTAAPDDSVGYVWAWCCIPTFVYCLGLWIKTQTNTFTLVDVVVDTQHAAPMAGLLAAPAVCVCIRLAQLYARQRSALPLALRVPQPTEKWPRGRVGDKARIVVVVGVLAIMTGSQIHFIDEVLKGSVYRYKGSMVAEGYAAMLSKWQPQWCCDNYRFGSPRGWTYWPPLESWLLLAVVLAVVALFSVYLFRDLRIQKYR